MIFAREFCPYGFFAAKPQKNQNKKGFGAAPQWEIRVSFMRMGFAGCKPLHKTVPFCKAVEEIL
jgi:hypothetical protein